MSDSTRCPRCGGELPANFPPGVCPTCLLQQGLSPSTFISGAGSAGGNSNTGRRRSWTPPTPAELAPRFPQLEIVELLGQGGMGAVYKVRQRDLDRWAALKVLPDDVAHDPNFAERFQREARALALLGHQHIVIVYEFGQRDGVYFLLMEYIDGITLRQAIRAGQVSAKDALNIVAQICDALQFAHEEGVVHRDIKPENILIDKRGRVKIADFGLAKLLGRATDVPTLTGTHQVMGTPMYMAPEQMEGTRGVDHRADIFSLGVVFYELLTGELPLGRFAPPSQKYQLDVRLDDVVLRTLEKEPDRRYQQASDVKCDVESIRSQPHVKPSAVVKKPRRSWTPMKIAATIVILVGLIGLSGMLLDRWENMSERSALARVQAAQYEKTLWQQRAQQETQHQSEGASQDPNEANALIQFTEDGPKLNAMFVPNMFTAEQRKVVNQILASIDKKYLAAELRHTKLQIKDDGTQVWEIDTFNDEISKLENDLWTAVDSQLPIEQQRVLRLNLPLFADASQPMSQVTAMGMQSMGGPMGAAPVGPMSPGTSGGAPGMMPGGWSGSAANFSTNLRYRHLFGWKRNNFPLRITVGRQGKWYRWLFEVGLNSTVTGINEIIIAYSIADRGEAPVLPSGLRRFWKENSVTEPKSLTMDSILTHGKPEPETGSERLTSDPFTASQFQTHTKSSPHAQPGSPPANDVAGQLQSLPSTTEDQNEAKPEIRFTPEGATLNPVFCGPLLSDDQQQIVNRILTKVHHEYLAMEDRHIMAKKDASDGTKVISIAKFEDEVSRLENGLWTEIDSQIPVEQQSFLRANMPLFADDAEIAQTAAMMITARETGGIRRPANLRHEQLLGWRQVHLPMQISISRRGKWYRWSIAGSDQKLMDAGEAPKLPSGLSRFWRDELESEPKVIETSGPQTPAKVGEPPSGSDQ